MPACSRLPKNRITMSDNKNYQPISCAYYDELEALAVQKVKSVVQYYDRDGNASTLTDVRITDFYVRNKVEFMKLDDGHEVQLDKLIAVNGKPMVS